MPAENEAPRPHESSLRREILLALSLLFGFTFGLWGLEQVLPSIGSLSQGLLAVALLFIPSFVLRKKAIHIDDLGVAMSPWRPTLTLATVTMLVVFTLFALGYHFFQTQMREAIGMGPNRHTDYTWDHLYEYDENLKSTPTDACRRAAPGVIAWVDGKSNRLWIVGPPRHAVSLELTPQVPSARLVTCADDGKITASGKTPLRKGWLRAGRHRRGLMVPLGNLERFSAHVRLDNLPLPHEHLRVGRDLVPTTTLTGERSVGWLFIFVLVQLILVAFPEEWFFRGYLQTRIDQWLGTRWKILGAELGWGWLLAAAAFACLHPILIPGPHRLLVFFPALLFGWLRARGGNIGPAVIVHASSNVLLAVLSRMVV